MQISDRKDLLPVTSEGRPVVLKDSQGWTVFVSVHDQEYLRQKREWRARIIAAHPDKLGISPADLSKWKSANLKFARLNLAAQVWKHKERAFYWRLGLMPPDWKGEPEPPNGLRESLAVPYKRRNKCASVTSSPSSSRSSRASASGRSSFSG